MHFNWFLVSQCMAKITHHLFLPELVYTSMQSPTWNNQCSLCFQNVKLIEKKSKSYCVCHCCQIKISVNNIKRGCTTGLLADQLSGVIITSASCEEQCFSTIVNFFLGTTQIQSVVLPVLCRRWIFRTRTHEPTTFRMLRNAHFPIWPQTPHYLEY